MQILVRLRSTIYNNAADQSARHRHAEAAQPMVIAKLRFRSSIPSIPESSIKAAVRLYASATSSNAGA
jgi:hypothetical protein